MSCAYYIGVPVESLTADMTKVTPDDYVDLGNLSSSLKLCRAKTKDIQVDYESLLLLNATEKEEEGVENAPSLNNSAAEDAATAHIVDLLQSNDQKFGNVTNPLYIKELNDSDLSSVLSSLQADKLYLDKSESTYFPEYFEFMRNFKHTGSDDKVHTADESNARKSRSNSFTESLQRMSSLLGLSSNHGSDASGSDCDNDADVHGKTTPTGEMIDDCLLA